MSHTWGKKAFLKGLKINLLLINSSVLLPVCKWTITVHGMQSSHDSRLHTALHLPYNASQITAAKPKIFFHWKITPRQRPCWSMRCKSSLKSDRPRHPPSSVLSENQSFYPGRFEFTSWGQCSIKWRCFRRWMAGHPVTSLPRWMCTWATSIS